MKFHIIHILYDISQSQFGGHKKSWRLIYNDVSSHVCSASMVEDAELMSRENK